MITNASWVSFLGNTFYRTHLTCISYNLFMFFSLGMFTVWSIFSW